MFRPRVIPVLLLKGTGLVKTIRFDKRKAVYLGDPINAVRLFNDFEADELIILDITASIERRTISAELVKKIGDEAFMPFSVGGGIGTVAEIKSLLAAGAEKVVINTSSIYIPQLIREAASQFGNQSIVVSIDVRGNLWGQYHMVIEDGTRVVKKDPIRHAYEMEQLGAGEIFVNFIDNDGTMKGYDLDYIKRFSGNLSIPVIACGGAGKLNHLREGIVSGGASAVAAGSMFVFHGDRKAVLINYPDRRELLELFN